MKINTSPAFTSNYTLDYRDATPKQRPQIETSLADVKIFGDGSVKIIEDNQRIVEINCADNYDKQLESEIKEIDRKKPGKIFFEKV